MIVLLILSLMVLGSVLGYLYWQKNSVIPMTYVNSVVTLDSPFKIEGLKPSDKIYKWENKVGRNGCGSGDGEISLMGNHELPDRSDVGERELCCSNHFYAAYVFDQAETHRVDITTLIAEAQRLGYPVRYWWWLRR